MSFSIRKRQIGKFIKLSESFDRLTHAAEVIKRMLNLHKAQDSKAYWQDVWKLLIYDDYCRAILSPLFKVGDLRQLGITLHMMINSDRQPVPDVPAIYFVMPTKENVDLMCRDCNARLYDQYYFNFASSIPRPLLEDLARTTLESDVVHQVNKVCDQYVNFVSLEDKLFSLQQPQSYLMWNDPTLSDTVVEHSVTQLVAALTSVVATLGTVPVIRAARGGAAAVIAQALDNKLRTGAVLGGWDESSHSNNFERPVMIIVDRHHDLLPLLTHGWSYQSLVHDLLNLELNRVTCPVKERNSVVQKSYDLDPSDSLWHEHAATPFPNVAVEIKTQVDEVQARINKSRDNRNNVDVDDDNGVVEHTRDLGTLITALPELQEKKRLLDMHTNISLALLDEINARSLDTFVSLEDALLTKSNVNKKDVLQALSDEKGTKEDKLRLFLIYYICNQQKLQPQELKELEQLLTAQGIDLKVFKYLKQIKAFDDTWTASVATASTKTNTNSLLKTDFLKSFTDLVSASVKYLIPATKDYHVTRVVDAVMELKSSPDIDNYLYLDPKFQPDAAPRKTTPFRQAIVFVLGGGNYLEYLNLMDYAKRSKQQKNLGLGKKIIYGTTELLTGKEFLHQLQQLADKTPGL